MPVKCVEITRAPKLGPIAATYRAGTASMYGTCPSSCSLINEKSNGTEQLDKPYLDAVKAAVPRRGHSWTYTHFSPRPELRTEPGQTVINISSDTVQQATDAADAGFPTVYAAPYNDTDWPRQINGRRFVQCPDKHTDCSRCGGDVPLCARRDRDYVIVFVGHGTKKKAVGQGETGGCYAENGRCGIQWRRTMTGDNRVQIDDDNPKALVKWVKTLRPGSLIRHHVAGDFGLQKQPRRTIPIKSL